jgi:hypothetical protein
LRLAHLLNHLVGALLEKQRCVEAAPLGGLEIEDDLESCRLFDPNIGDC